MNKIVKKIIAFSSLLAMSSSAVGCFGGAGTSNGPLGELESGFWANLAATSVGGGNSGTLENVTGDLIVNGNPTAVEEYKGGNVTINFYHTRGATLRNGLDRWIPEFNKMYPTITVKHNSYGAYQDLRDQITTELQAGKAPSLAYCYPDHVALYQKSGKVVALDDYISSTKTVTRKDGTTEQMGFTQAELNEFVRAYFEEGRAYGDNKVYSLPYEKSTEVLFYNKDFFEEHELSVPTTWDEMETVIQQIKEIDPNCIPLGYDSEGNWFITMCQQLNTPYTTATEGNKFVFDVSTNQAFVGRLREWYQRHWVTTEVIFGSFTSDLFTETDPDEVKSYMCIGSSAGASYQCPDPVTADDGSESYPFEVGVAMPPQLDPSSPKVISQGPSICMFKKDSQEMAASWLFMKFLTTNLGLQAEYSMSSGYAPIIKNLDQKLPKYADDLAAADGNANLQATCVKQCLAQEAGLFVSPAFWGSSAARDEVGSLIQKCLVNPLGDGQTVAQFIDANFKAALETLRYNYFD